MLLVPRELQRAGMTGTVPYCGGRFSPSQAYAVSHPQSGPPRPLPSATPVAPVHAPVPTARPPVPASAPPRSEADALDALAQLIDSGVITAAEYDQLRSRMRP
ncbi:MAG: hypothetical protein WCG47_01765 [Dermatophilaceae bacterium]